MPDADAGKAGFISPSRFGLNTVTGLLFWFFLFMGIIYILVLSVSKKGADTSKIALTATIGALFAVIGVWLFRIFFVL